MVTRGKIMYVVFLSMPKALVTRGLNFRVVETCYAERMSWRLGAYGCARKLVMVTKGIFLHVRIHSMPKAIVTRGFEFHVKFPCYAERMS